MSLADYAGYFILIGILGAAWILHAPSSDD